MGYKKGTQEQLDAAREDALLLPSNTVFKAKKNKDSSIFLPDGEILVRGHIDGYSTSSNNSDMVGFKLLDGSDYWFVDANDLEPIND